MPRHPAGITTIESVALETQILGHNHSNGRTPDGKSQELLSPEAVLRSEMSASAR
jgi:hypothetical protein